MEGYRHRLYQHYESGTQGSEDSLRGGDRGLGPRHDLQPKPVLCCH